jgi:ribosomal-protein-alanine N-acetyltransferase
MPFALEPMRLEDVPEVVEIEKICFTTPWPASSYIRELKNSQSTRYVVVRHYKEMPTEPPLPPAEQKKTSFLNNLISRLNKQEDTLLPNFHSENPVVGYAGLWMMMDEAHITTVGVQPDYRGKSMGELLLVGLIDVAMQLGASWLTLEVRVSNVVAQNLYKKYSFSESGVRKKYYTDNDEDAYIMWSEEITRFSFREKYATLKRNLLEGLAAKGELVPGVDHTRPLILVDPSDEPLDPPQYKG